MQATTKGGVTNKKELTIVAIVTCGKETLVATSQDAEVIKFADETEKTITLSEYKEWFKFQAVDDSGSECGDDIIYSLVAENGDEINADTAIKLESDTIQITPGEISAEGKTVYFQAKTKGGVTA